MGTNNTKTKTNNIANTPEVTPANTPEVTPQETPQDDTNDTNDTATVKLTRKVVSVTRVTSDPKRVRIEVDGEPFEAIRPDGETIDTNSFSIDARYLCGLLDGQIEPLDYATTMAMGQRINPVIIALCLKGATVTVTRTFRAAGEQRKFGESVYNSDTWTTDEIKATPKLTQFVAGQLLNLINTALLDTPTPSGDSAEIAAANWANV